METIAGCSSSANKGNSKTSKRLKDVTGNELPSSVHKVMSDNYDLLFEILLRLPVLSLFLFKSVSKHWFTIITSPSFTTLHLCNQNPNFSRPSGLFLRRYRGQTPLFQYEFVSLDTRVPSKVWSFGYTESGINLPIVNSCNGLILGGNINIRCGLYVYNRTLDLHKRLPQPIDELFDHVGYGSLMAFDPTKSPHYKVIHARPIDNGVGSYTQIQTYSSETGNWSVCSNHFPFEEFLWFDTGIFWNDAIHWVASVDHQVLHFKLDIVKYPFLTFVQTPMTINGVNPNDFKLFESCERLLFLFRDFDSRMLISYDVVKIYEMVSNEWLVKYIVNLDDIIMQFPQTYRICCNVMCIVLGEKDEDSFMVLTSHKKTVRYNIVLKITSTLCDFEVGSSDCFQFIPSFADV